MFIRNGENAERLDDLSNQILRTIWQSNPVGATILGIHEYDNTIGDVSASGFRGYCSSLRGCIEALESEVDPAHLDAEQELNHRVALALAHSYLVMFEQQRAWQNNPSVYGSQAVWGCMSLLIRNPGPVQDRMRLVLDRLRQIPEMLSISKGNICDPASMFVQMALDVNKGALSFFRDELPSIAAGTPFLSDIRAANENAIAAFEDYDKWLRDDVLPHANGDFAVGSSVYEQMIQREHCLTCSPSDLVSLGEDVLRESQERIAEVAAAIDPSVSWTELMARLKQDHPPKEGLVDAYRQAVESTLGFLRERDLVSIADDAQLSVGVTPEIERIVMPYAAYFPPAPFGDSKHGFLWVTPIDESASEEQQQSQLREHCNYSIPIIALHDGIPGHHLQMTRAMDSPYPVRRQMLNSLFMEGWALYCEEMMYEQGFYTDPRVRLFQLKDTIWRACRVIIDVGIHTGSMTFDDAVTMLMDKACIEETTASAEVKRYAMSPTQPMTYVVGKLLLLDLREQMKSKLGRRFSLKDFHDRVLSFGSIPPALIAERMTSEVESSRSEFPVLRSA